MATPKGFNKGYTVVQSLDLGVETSTGVDAAIPNPPWERYALPWGLSGGFQANEVDPFSTVFVCIGTGAGSSPAIQNISATLPNGSRPHRVSAAMRAGDDSAGVAGPLLLQTLVVLRYNIAGGFGISLGLNSRKSPLPGVMIFSVIYAGVTSTYTWEAPVYANTYYTVGLEVLDRKVNAYLDPIGAADTRGLTGTENLTLLGSSDIPGPFPAVRVAVGLVPGGKFATAGSYGCALGNVFLEELEGPPGGPGATDSPSPGGPPGGITVPPATMYDIPGGILDSPRLPDAVYSQYKSLRKAMLVLNNLDLR